MARTVIDSLVIELGLDPTKLTAGQRASIDSLKKFEREAVGAGNRVEAQNKRTVETLANLRREVVATVGLFLGGRGIIAAFREITNLDAATGRFAATLALGVSDLSAWQGAIKQSGGSAEGATAALSGLSGEMNRFVLTGQSGMLPVLSRLGISLYDSNRRLKTSAQLWLDIASAVEGMDPRQATAFLSMIPGANQDMVNFALSGRRAMEAYIEAARLAGTTTAQSAELARDYQRVVAKLDQSATELGRTFTVLVYGPLTRAIDKVTELMQLWRAAPGSAEGNAVETQGRKAAVDRLGSPRAFLSSVMGAFAFSKKDRDELEAWLTSIYGPPGAHEAGIAAAAASARGSAAAARAAAPPTGTAVTGSGYSGTSTAQVEAMIREEAVKRGIDPAVAIEVARREGLYNYKSTVPGEESYGPYQLYFGSKGGGGLGPKFMARTGIDPRTDRSAGSVRAQIQFALDEAKAGGWRPWYGWKGPAWAGIGGAAGAAAAMGPTGAAPGAANTTVQIGDVHVNTRATDAEGIARDIAPALRRSMTAGAANYGQR